MLLIDERDGKSIINYCEKCKIEHKLPQSSNFLFQGFCEVCGLPSFMVYFTGMCCLIEKNVI